MFLPRSPGERSVSDTGPECMAFVWGAASASIAGRATAVAVCVYPSRHAGRPVFGGPLSADPLCSQLLLQAARVGGWSQRGTCREPLRCGEVLVQDWEQVGVPLQQLQRLVAGGGGEPSVCALPRDGLSQGV